MPDDASALADQPLQVEVWSDIVCPWCYIGKRRLEQALATDPGPAHIVHRAFQLDPSARTEGRKTSEVLAGKYRLSAEQAEAMMQQVTEVASGDGLAYRLDQTTSGNTGDAHRLLLWAQEAGLGQELIEALYSGYFTQGLPVFTTDELIGFTERAGLDVQTARTVLDGDAYREQVERDQQTAAQLGATGVPFFVIDGRFGISGAQPVEVFSQALAQARAASTRERG